MPAAVCDERNGMNQLGDSAMTALSSAFLWGVGGDARVQIHWCRWPYVGQGV